MVEAGTAPQPSVTRSRLWVPALLVLSLALNLIVVGVIGVRFLAPDRIERFTGTRFSPLVPRSFIADLPDGRRKELTEILGRNRSEFRATFAAMRQSAMNFADALEKTPYDEAQVLTAISDYDTKGTGLIHRGNDVTVDLVRRLTPEERVLLAAKVRERASAPRGSHRSSDP